MLKEDCEYCKVSQDEDCQIIKKDVNMVIESIKNIVAGIAFFIVSCGVASLGFELQKAGARALLESPWEAYILFAIGSTGLNGTLAFGVGFLVNEIVCAAFEVFLSD